MQLARTVRQPGKKHIQTGYAKSTNTNGLTLRRLRPDRDPTIRTGKTKGQQNRQKMANPSRPTLDASPIGQTEVQYIKRNTSQQRQSIQ